MADPFNPPTVPSVRPSPPDSRDFIAEAIFPAELVVPATLDYRSELPPIRHQGEQQACSAFVGAAMKEWQEKREVRFNGSMAPQFLYDRRQNRALPGMFSRDLFDVLYKHGCPPEQLYPYGQDRDPAQTSADAINEAAKFRIKGYAQVFTIEALKKALVKNGPCYMALPQFNEGATFWHPPAGEKMIGGHAVTVVGYDGRGFILRNSWGVGWGEAGCTIFPYSDWGMQWEVWTTLDDTSPLPDPAYNRPINVATRNLRQNQRPLLIGAVVLLAFMLLAVLAFS